MAEVKCICGNVLAEIGVGETFSVEGEIACLVCGRVLFNKEKSDRPLDYVDMNTYQDLARETAIYPDINPDAPGNPYYPALGLAGEVGEYCNKLKKVMRDKGGVMSLKFIGDAEQELGDVLWYLAACASELGLDLGTIAQLNLDKLSARKDKGTLNGDGDDR